MDITANSSKRKIRLNNYISLITIGFPAIVKNIAQKKLLIEVKKVAVKEGYCL